MRSLIRGVIVILALVLLAAVFVPRLTHTCDNCETFFLGTGYSANMVSDAITTITGQEDKILCKDCAMQEHAIAIGLGQSLDDFKLPLFYKGD